MKQCVVWVWTVWVVCSTPLWSNDRLVIEIAPPDRGLKVFDKDFFAARARLPQFSRGKPGGSRYFGDPSTVSGEQRQAWVDTCLANQKTQLRECYKQLQRDAVKR